MNIVETTQSLVRIPSVNPAYDPASLAEIGMSDWLIAWAKEHGFEHEANEVMPGRSNVIIRLRNGPEHPHLLLNGHTDTVAIAKMTVPPFDAELRDGRIWGRGSADMKGQVACMLHTLLRLREDTAAWKGTVTVGLVVDEEVGFTGIKHLLQNHSGFDFAIVGEPTRLEIVRGCKGCLRFAFRAHGKSAHSSTPEKGASAIIAMAHALVALECFFAEDLSASVHPALGRSTGSVGIVQGGSGINIVPEFCEAKVDVRLVPGQSWEETYAAMKKVVTSIERPGIHWDFDEPPFWDLPFCWDEDHEFVRSACETMGRTQSHVVNYACDASKIAAAGIPCIVFGPGDIAQAHTANESIAVEELEQGVESYVRFAEALLKAD